MVVIMIAGLLSFVGVGAVLYGVARASGVTFSARATSVNVPTPTSSSRRVPTVTIEDVEPRARAPEPTPSQPASDAANMVVPIGGYPRFTELEWLARTMWGEARGETDFGMRAVGHVIMNRVRDRAFGDTIAATVTQGNGSQFNVWRRADPNYSKAIGVTTFNADYVRALRIAAEIMQGQSVDPTNGSIIYFNERASTDSRFVQAVLGQVATGQARRVDIGNHSFFPGAR